MQKGSTFEARMYQTALEIDTSVKQCKSCSLAVSFGTISESEFRASRVVFVLLPSSR